jgi:hypothetical protein
VGTKAECVTFTRNAGTLAGLKKGTFDVNLVFTATLACTKRALFITKKGTFSPLKKLGGGGHVPLVPPGSYAPVFVDC